MSKDEIIEALRLVAMGRPMHEKVEALAEALADMLSKPKETTKPAKKAKDA